MKSKLYYFSGTGNSLLIARKLAKALEAPLVPMVTASPKEAGHQERIGLIFPTYMHRMPWLVKGFIDLIESVAYSFVVAVHAGEPGGVFLDLKKALAARSQDLKAGFSIKMPNNYLPFGEAVAGEQREILYQEADKKIQFIIDTVKRGGEHIDPPSSFFNRIIHPGLLYSMGYRYINYLDKNFWTDESCNSCKICERVCPVNNIVMEEGKPVWKKACQQCFACLNFCPQSSIQYGKKTIGLKRYHHPEVSAKDIMAQKKGIDKS